MQPVDLHRTLLAALPRRNQPLTLDDVLCLLPGGRASADDFARWLEWARSEGYLADAGVYGDRRCFRLHSLTGRRRSFRRWRDMTRREGGSHVVHVAAMLTSP
jgi:hypothetical protein